jgi:hypothetical protein
MRPVIHPCEHDGCNRPGDPCWLGDDPDDAPSFYFCPEHAHVEGFCRGCGGFFGGIESFDFSPSGLCETCEVDPGGDDPDEDEDWMDDEFWP